MGHHDQRTAPDLELILQPLDPLQVEMIRGLIQQEDIRLLQQQPRQQRPRLLPAAEMGDRRVELVRVEAQPPQDLADPRLVGEPTIALKRLEFAPVALDGTLTLGIILRTPSRLPVGAVAPAAS